MTITRSPDRKTQQGFTLIELMIVLAVLAIGITLAVPAFTEFRQRTAVRSAAEQYMTLLAEQRFDAVKRNAIVTIDFGNVQVPDGVTVSAMSMTSNGGSGTIRINPRDGMITADSVQGNVTVSSGNYQLRFSVNPLGRGSVCAPAGSSVPGYKTCT